MKVILITGCSSGFGRLMAKRFADCGWKVYAGVRRLTRGTAASLNLTQNGTIEPVALDVTDQARIADVVDHIKTREGRIDALVNNAGMNILGAFEDTPEQAWRQLMEVNFFGPVRLTRAVLPMMRKQGRGTIVMLSSLSGLIGLPGNASYTSTKFALEGATESLRHEVAPFGIKIALVEPGAFKTAMPTRLKLADNYPPSSPYAAMLDACLPGPDAADHGDDPQLVADLVYQIVNPAHTRLRHPAGTQAQKVTRQLAAMDDTERAKFVREVTDLAWWIDTPRS